MSKRPTSPDEIRSEAFASLENDMNEVRLLSEAMVFVAEKLLVEDYRFDEDVNLSPAHAQMLEFMVSKTVSLVQSIERKWGDAHDAASTAETEQYRQERGL